MSYFLKSTYLVISLFAITIGVQSCGSTQNTNKLILEENPPFTLAEAYFQKWVAGIETAGAGIDVYVVFANLNPVVEIQDIFFRNQSIGMRKSLDNPKEYFANLSDNSRLEVVMHKNPIKEAQNTFDTDFPFVLNENEAVISYLFEGKTHYYKIPDLSEKKLIAYPQSNPSRD